MMDNRPLGERIREYRALHCLSVRQFAQIAKVHFLTVHHIEQNANWRTKYATKTRIEHILAGNELPE